MTNFENFISNITPIKLAQLLYNNKLGLNKFNHKPQSCDSLWCENCVFRPKQDCLKSWLEYLLENKKENPHD